MGKYESWREDLAREIIANHAHRQGPVLPILHDVQRTFGYVPEPVIPMIAEALNLSRAEVHGVVTFYHDFRTAPPGAHVLKLCRAEACQAMGCERIERRLRNVHGAAVGATSPDGQLTVEAVYCLGNCALGPSAMIDGRLHGRVTAPRLDALLMQRGARS